MSIRVAINHMTRYRYDRRVSLSPHIFRLRPAVHSRTPIEAYSLNILPRPHFINWQQDPFGNFLARVVFPEKTDELRITVDLVADMTVINPFDFFLEESAEIYPFSYNAQSARELIPYLECTEDGPRLRDYMKAVDAGGRKTVDFLVDLNQRLCRDMRYTIRLEPGVQTCEETLGLRSGSCRDSAWLLVQILRRLGLAARFVSGYLVQLTADVASLDGPSGPAADFTDLHAWAEAFVPGAGWIGLDPTSGLFAGEGHIPLACTPDPVSAAPVTGATDVCEVTFSYRNSVQRIHEDPRVTKPYTDGQWEAVNQLGLAVDARLAAGDVRLSMGGEPTFVSIDDMESPQWNTDANGEHKRRLAGDLIRRLYDAFAPGGLLHYGQGKWYPGEPLPRWALACYWRQDGVPVCQNPNLLADESIDYGFKNAEASALIRETGRRLGLDDAAVIPAYEDVVYHLWAEGSLPTDIDPLKADLKDPIERQRLARLLAGGLNEPAGYILPLRWSFSKNGWMTSPWPIRRERLYLIPGDSPMGLRLPLDTLPQAAEDKKRVTPERSLLGEFPPLGPIGPHPDVPPVRPEPPAPETGVRPPLDMPRTDVDTVSVVRTALCVENRNGRIYVFMPPFTYLEHYLECLAALEGAAGRLRTPIVVEGYPPPTDPRLTGLKVTPDPGVIEVNIHPVLNWPSLVRNTETLYEAARLSRLGTEKCMLDGRHTGTGGGNHVSIGGPTPADSPILRRPDLLQRLITYWQHHPGRSYLFAGLFIGATSQAPRIDEGRDEMLYELETAFDQIPANSRPPFWLVDRVFRHLLTDITGNTHRTEFCIDKLYSPDTLSGQQGLVEFRAFEMPPHARMSLVQLLLLRCLIARFWETPYRHGLVRWGTELHDRWMLPHFVERDLQEVTGELDRAGYPFDMAWLAPFVEFRFPRYGTVHLKDIAIELRMAMEPWPVLGEEVVRSATARFVDSSLERLQVKVTGMTDDRYVLACNGRPVPLRRTGTQSEYVAGVRYRAWQPPSALHPTIGVHSPLVFDLVDTWNGRSIGGCTYHVMHPGGRNYDRFPVNAFEAEARRISRFWGYGHTPSPAWLPQDEPGGTRSRFTPGRPVGPMGTPPAEPNPEYPYTLDLRRKPADPTHSPLRNPPR